MARLEINITVTIGQRHVKDIFLEKSCQSQGSSTHGNMITILAIRCDMAKKFGGYEHALEKQ